ncbi:DUF6083 domain-containing protein [Streptomyces sp. NPDC050264]|uniref:DUF6083 domain-containing protein n=1 Tax=Streptomyces sp. NPDC050264 TaxID=3155038 RepID=UPI003442BF4E
MGDFNEKVRRLGSAQLPCPACGLPQEQVQTLEHEPVLLEPDMLLLAHTVPADHRWIELSDGRVALYGVCPPDPFQRCRILHELACPGQALPDLWPWLTTLRQENARKAERQHEEPPPLPPGTGHLPDVG